MNYSKFTENSKFGVKDSSGKIIIEPIYNSIVLDLADQGFIGASLNKKWGLYDLQGNEIIKPIYDDIWLNEVDKGFIKIKLDKRWGLLDKLGNKLLPSFYDFGTDLVTLNQKKIKIRDSLLR